MAEPTKKESKQGAVNKIPLSDSSQDDFQRRAKMYQTEVELLQRKFSVVQRPIITPFGPDIQLADAKKLPSQTPPTA